MSLVWLDIMVLMKNIRIRLRALLVQAIFLVEVSYRLSFAMPSVLSKSATSVTSASRSVCDGSALCGSLPKYVKAEARDRRHKQRQLLMAQFGALIPDCYEGNRCAFDKFPQSAAEVAVWLWTAQLIPRIVRLEQVVAIVATFIEAPYW